MSKTIKLKTHSQRSSGNQNDLLLTSKDFVDVVIGDVLEIYHQDGDFSRLLLPVELFSDDSQRDCISIADNIATAFQLRPYTHVTVSKVDPKNVALDLVELLFKDQYYNRSDMWRLLNIMKSQCVYLNKKIEHAEMRCTINDMWSKGDKVTCGVISEDTRVVFRSSTAVVQILIQLSSEMWEFDPYGDLYFEKAVNGFLTDLFFKWKEQNCCHDVTIVLFSRTFYVSKSLVEGLGEEEVLVAHLHITHTRQLLKLALCEARLYLIEQAYVFDNDFPSEIRECLQVDNMGDIYEDFYRVILQNERYDEWNGTLTNLRRLINQYRDYVLSYHHRQWPSYNLPKARNSSAAQGNLLETLNMSLNLFENYNLDRNFDRTGKLSVVITAGPGVFEVDRELTFITKQRTIDCGVGSDLVCMSEHPLHGVPLFKFRSKNVQSYIEVGDDYNIPHWMNQSFYTSKIQRQYQSNFVFVPRIRPPPDFMKWLKSQSSGLKKLGIFSCKREIYDDGLPFVDYDEHDENVFKMPFRSSKSSKAGRQGSIPQNLISARNILPKRFRCISDNQDSEFFYKNQRSTSSAIRIPNQRRSRDDISISSGYCFAVGKVQYRESFESSGSDDLLCKRPIVGSAGPSIGSTRRTGACNSRRALINPFAPSRLQFKVTSNVRRWVHALPTNAKGMTFRPHHVQECSTSTGQDHDLCPPPKIALQHKSDAESRSRCNNSECSTADVEGATSNSLTTGHTSSLKDVNAGPHHSVGNVKKKLRKKDKYKLSEICPPEQKWSPDLATGVDWRSLTIPASLPITTDYFPDENSLMNDYVLGDYNLLPDVINADYFMRPSLDRNLAHYRRPPLTTRNVFMELVSQRLGQGFQLIIGIPVEKGKFSRSTSKYSVGCSEQNVEADEEYYLSIGRIFHKLKMKGSTITVTRYWPSHPHPQRLVVYRYRFQAPDSFSYDASTTKFCNELLENYAWNYLDQYICTRGEGDFGLVDSLKFWRSRFFLLPSFNVATKAIMDNPQSRCDIYTERNTDKIRQLFAGFIRFAEILNKLKKSPLMKRPKSRSEEMSPTKLNHSNKENLYDSLTIDSSLSKIADAMIDPQYGLNFIQGQCGLPGNCFVAAEAALWVQSHVAQVYKLSDSMNILQKLVDDGYILHASGNAEHKFIFGFYLFYFVYSKAKSEHHVVPPGCSYNCLFQDEWMEVSMHPTATFDDLSDIVDDRDDSLYLALDRLTWPAYDDPNVVTDDWRQQSACGSNGWYQRAATLQHKYVNVDVTVNASKKNDRQVWATARYHADFIPSCAFELQVLWLVASGTLLGDLIISWARKASVCGFHLIPVPSDPFALPESINSDPLRGPIFILLSINMDGNAFADCIYDTEKEQRLYFIQEIILKRFGFVPCGVRHTNVSRASDRPRSSLSLGSELDEKRQYVHCTVGMFVLIPDWKPSTPSPHRIGCLDTATTARQAPPSSWPSTRSPLDGTRHRAASPVESATRCPKRSSSNRCHDYIARQLSQQRDGEPDVHSRVGFLWAWNFMSSKLWRSPNTGYEDFQDHLLADFRLFCRRGDGRLDDLLLTLGLCQRRTRFTNVVGCDL